MPCWGMVLAKKWTASASMTDPSRRQRLWYCKRPNPCGGMAEGDLAGLAADT